MPSLSTIRASMTIINPEAAHEVASEPKSDSRMVRRRRAEMGSQHLFSAAYTIANVTITKSQPVQMLDFSRQFAGIREELLRAIEEVCESQRFILGPQVGSFEAAAARACKVPHAIGCASGTDSIWLALVAGNVFPGDAVITTPF